MLKSINITTPLVALALLLIGQAPCSAEIIKLTANLSGSEELPPISAKGSGALKGLYDTTTKKLSWSISYSGLTGPVTRADFHASAAAGEHAPIKVGIDTAGVSSGMPIEGSANLTDRFEPPLDKALLNGKFYINLHTADHPNGEIRGQILTEK
jgi:CHRD domain